MDNNIGSNAPLKTAPEGKKDKLIDIHGVTTGIPVNKKIIVALAASVAVYFLLSAIDLSAYGEMASKGLGLFTATVVFMILGGVDIFIPALAMIFIGILLGFWDWGGVSAALGSSPFYMMLGMMIVAMGAEFTPFGRRVAYVFLKLFGQKPVRLVFVFGIVTTILSAFVSNVATVILMSGIGATLLASMGEKPGESHIGKAIMLIICMGSMLGGCVLFSGSPMGNTVQLTMLQNSTNGAYTVTYGQWAFFGILTFAVAILPICWIYVKCCGVKNSGFNLPSKEYYDKLLRELGPMTGAEYRWVATVVVMVALMISGQNTAMMAMLFALITFLPGIGCMPAGKCCQRLPITLLLAIGIIPMMANLLTETGVVAWVTSILSPVLNFSSPLAFSIVCCLVMGVCCNLLVNAMTAFSMALLALLAPIAVSLGYNPTVVMLPSMFAASFFWCLSMNTMMLLNRGHGFWGDRDCILPGFLSLGFVCVVIPIICCATCGLVGLSPYI